MWEKCGNWFLPIQQLCVQMRADELNVDKETV